MTILLPINNYKYLNLYNIQLSRSSVITGENDKKKNPPIFIGGGKTSSVGRSAREWRRSACPPPAPRASDGSEPPERNSRTPA